MYNRISWTLSKNLHNILPTEIYHNLVPQFTIIFSKKKIFFRQNQKHTIFLNFNTSQTHAVQHWNIIKPMLVCRDS